MVMNDTTALARWDDEGGSVEPRARQGVAAGRDGAPLPKAVPPLGLYQRASLQRTYDAGFAVRAPLGLFSGARDSSASTDGTRPERGRRRGS